MEYSTSIPFINISFAMHNYTDHTPDPGELSSTPRNEDPYIEYLTGYITFVIFVIGVLGACAQIIMKRTQQRQFTAVRDLIEQMNISSYSNQYTDYQTIDPTSDYNYCTQPQNQSTTRTAPDTPPYRATTHLDLRESSV